MTHADGDILRERRGPIYLIGIDRPAKRNGFTLRMMHALCEAYTEYEDDPGLRCAVLHAFGHHFTAGLDLPSVAPTMRAGGSIVPSGLIDPFDLREGERRRTKPLVCAVKGITFTLGIELMLAADIVIAAHDCRFSQLEVKRGIMATGGATLRIAERAGMGNALLYLLTGDEFDIAAAFRMGLVQRVVMPGDELDTALEIAGRIAEQAPLAVAATRQSVLAAFEEGPRATAARFHAVQKSLANSADAAEGVRAFVERRPARFTGR